MLSVLIEKEVINWNGGIMKKIFIGLLLIFINFNLTLGAVKIGLFPDFLGYIVMLSGLTEMSGMSELFGKAKPWASGMAVYTGILYGMDLFGITIANLFSIVLGLTSLAISLYISYNIVMGVIEVELNNKVDLNGENLKSAWKAMTLFNVITYFSVFVTALSVILIIGAIIIAIYFLILFNKSKNMYYESFPYQT